MKRPLFSILHSSARPHKWREIYDAWINAALHPEHVEYVLCVDERWGFTHDFVNSFEVERAADLQPLNLVVWNTQRRCYVDGVNTAAKASTGEILIVNADDQYPCGAWDIEITAAINRVYPESHRFGCPRIVVEVSTGTPQEHERGILVMPILSRERYEAMGYVFYPEYESMYADNEFCEHAEQDGAIIDARHLFFPHRHGGIDPETATWKKVAQVDEQHNAQNRREAYELGSQLLPIRRAERFDPAARHNIQKRSPDALTNATTKPQTTLALCWPGELFHSEYVKNLLRLNIHLWRGHDFAVWEANEFTSNVFVTREQIRKVMLLQTPLPDLFLWIDDDNPAPSPEQFDLLLADLELDITWPDGTVSKPDGVTGWCYIYSTDRGTFHPSCGTFSPDGLRWRPFDVYFFPQETKPRPVEITGFPCFLMRRSALEKAGERPFLPITDETYDHGLSGEDFAFCSKAQAGGAKFLVDPRVRVRHLKTSDALPNVPPPQFLPDPKIAVMMRVKNEARWIERCINSVIPLAGENVFVMDDESTDKTLQLVRALGVNTYADPFAGEPLDETRDKEWLLTQVKAACDPDWILCIDGDEELEPDGPEMIRRVLSTNPDVDVFALNFLYLWNSFDQIRVDGRYSSLGRLSLFRAKGTGIHFRSYYEGKDGGDPKVHIGLHCGNAPVAEGRHSPINVNLLHYGYVFREDRIRKYNWYRAIDPDNPHEDNYRHMVIGDLPEFPADMKMDFGGPLVLRKLTPRMVPHFDVMPQPLGGEDLNLSGATPPQAINSGADVRHHHVPPSSAKSIAKAEEVNA